MHPPDKVRSLLGVGALIVGPLLLAGCGGHPATGPAAAPPTGTATHSTASSKTASVSPSRAAAGTTSGPPSTAAADATSGPPSTAAADAASGHAGRGPLLLVQAFGGSVAYAGRRPATIGFSRDSTNIVEHLTWTEWTAGGAVGQGTLGQNNCQPSCASGTVTPVPATIHLSAPVDGHFTAMTETAGSMKRVYSYPSNWAASAS